MSYPVGPFRRNPLGGVPLWSPLMVSPGPIIYIDSRLGYDALADGANVDTLVDQSGHALNLPKGGAVAPSTIQKTANLSPTGQPLLRFKVGAGACITDLGIYSLTWAGAPPPFNLGWPDRQPNGYTFYWWVRATQRNLCGGGGGSNGAGGGSTNRPRIRFFFITGAGTGAVQITVTNGGFLAWSATMQSEADGVGRGIHTITMQVPPALTGIVPIVRVDGVQAPLIAGQDVPLTEWTEEASTEIQVGNAPTTTPAITGEEGLESDLGCFIFYAQQHSLDTVRRIERWMRTTFGTPNP